MTNEEFDVLDELYFVIHYDELLVNTGLSDEELIKVLISLLDKGWIKCLKTADEEVIYSDSDFRSNCKHYYYLATKAGLLAHNGR
jgi:hypothetical protein